MSLLSNDVSHWLGTYLDWSLWTIDGSMGLLMWIKMLQVNVARPMSHVASVNHWKLCWLNTLRRRQHGRHFPDDIFSCIFFNENIWIAINISLSFVPKGLIDNIQALVQIMAWRRSGGKPLSEPMMVSLLTHICVTRPQWEDKWHTSVLHLISS